MASFDFVVGTFGTPVLFTLRFTPGSPTSGGAGKLTILKQHSGLGSHSWLHIQPNKKFLYATAWTEPPALAAYKINSPTDISLLNTVVTNSRSGYVCASNTHVYSAGGATGEAFAIDSQTGAYVAPSSSSDSSAAENHAKYGSIKPVQVLDFVSDQPQKDDGSTMDFGGLRHGSHSADLSPDGRTLYIADIGRNCIWVYTIDHASSKVRLSLSEKFISPRSHDGPRHVWPHPKGKVVYSLQEHSSMVDVFSSLPDAKGDVKLKHVQGVRIIPTGLPVGDFWADEVRTSLSNGQSPKYLYASTRGLKNDRKGYVAVFALNENGLIDGATVLSETSSSAERQNDQDQGGLLGLWETPTSGGWANAIQPGPTVSEVEYIAMTDSEEGWVFVLGWDGKKVTEAARVNLNEVSGNAEKKHGAATAIWL